MTLISTTKFIIKERRTPVSLSVLPICLHNLGLLDRTSGFANNYTELKSRKSVYIPMFTLTQAITALNLQKNAIKLSCRT